MKSLRFLRKRTQPFLFAAMVSATIRRLHSGSCGNSYICNTSIKFWISGFWLHTHSRICPLWLLYCTDKCEYLEGSAALAIYWGTEKTNLGKDYKTNVRFMSMGNLKKTEKSRNVLWNPCDSGSLSRKPVSSVLSWFWILWTNMERKTVITLNLSTDNQLVIEFRPEVYESLIVTF